MSAGAGWIGPMSQVEYFLSVVHADRDADGKFLIYGEPVVTFMGMGEEAVVPSGAEYSVESRRCNLAAGLSITSYGKKVCVIA